MMRVLYLSRDGMLEPLGQTQVLPYLRGLAARDARLTLLSYEKPADRRHMGRERALRGALERQGIRWIPLTYHRHPALLAPAWDMAVGLARGWRLIRRERIQAVHARSYVAGMMAWCLSRVCGIQLLFDMRGFWVDERAEAGAWWGRGVLYRGAKRVERQLVCEADEIITLTACARRTIRRWKNEHEGRVSVIPTCVDLARFAPTLSAAPLRAPGDSPVFLYAGSVAPWYLPVDIFRIVRCALAKFPGARLVMLTRERDAAARTLRHSGLPPDRAQILSVDPAEVPAYLAQAHAGLALYRPGFSRQGTCPTKIGEYLAMGLPVVVNAGIGDVEEIVGAGRVGVVVTECSPSAYDRALDQLVQLWADPTLAQRCRQVAERHFSLQMGIDRYWAIYQRLAGAHDVSPAEVEVA